MISIEKWQEIFEGKIPAGQYGISLKDGEKEGLVIELISTKHNVVLNFGVVSAYRVLNEGIALNNLFDDEQIDKFRETGFSNVVYQVDEGDFGKFIQKISGGLYEYLNLKHYVVISENYIIEIVTEWEPDIQVS